VTFENMISSEQVVLFYAGKKSTILFYIYFKI